MKEKLKELKAAQKEAAKIHKGLSNAAIKATKAAEKSATALEKINSKIAEITAKMDAAV
jgi:hypothetical protein